MIINNITKHKSLMDSQVNLANIVEAEAARTESYRVFEQIQEFQSRSDFERVKSAVSANMYDDELEKVLRKCSIKSPGGSWLECLAQFQAWADPTRSNSRLLWLQGIPGAGAYCLPSKSPNSIC